MSCVITWNNSADIVTQPSLQDKVGGGMKKIHAPIYTGIGASVEPENHHPLLLGMKIDLL